MLLKILTTIYGIYGVMVMKCLYCNNNTRVIDSRESEGSTRRRRECINCKKRFTTYERANIELMVIKKDGEKEAFDREKLKNGIIRACEKRPITIEDVDNIVDKIEIELRKLNKKDIKSVLIGRKVIQKLKKLDQVAYVRFASVYKEFKDVNAFKEEIKQLA